MKYIIAFLIGFFICLVMTILRNKLKKSMNQYLKQCLILFMFGFISTMFIGCNTIKTVIDETEKQKAEKIYYAFTDRLEQNKNKRFQYVYKTGNDVQLWTWISDFQEANKDKLSLQINVIYEAINSNDVKGTYEMYSTLQDNGLIQWYIKIVNNENMVYHYKVIES